MLDERLIVGKGIDTNIHTRIDILRIYSGTLIIWKRNKSYSK